MLGKPQLCCTLAGPCPRDQHVKVEPVKRPKKKYRQLSILQAFNRQPMCKTKRVTNIGRAADVPETSATHLGECIVQACRTLYPASGHVGQLASNSSRGVPHVMSNRLGTAGAALVVSVVVCTTHGRRHGYGQAVWLDRHPHFGPKRVISKPSGTGCAKQAWLQDPPTSNSNKTPGGGPENPAVCQAR
jgi:hypothetical protein